MEPTSYGNTPATPLRPNNGDGTLDKAASSAHAAVDDAARRARPAIDQVSAMAHQAVDRAAGAAAPTAEWLSDKGESINATQKKLMADTCSYVSANPLKSVGIALVAGFLLSRIVH